MTLPWRLIIRLSTFITHNVLFCIAVFFILLIITQTLSRHFMAVFPFVVGENVVLEEFDGICLIDFIKGFLFPLYEVPGRITCFFFRSRRLLRLVVQYNLVFINDSEDITLL